MQPFFEALFDSSSTTGSRTAFADPGGALGYATIAGRALGLAASLKPTTKVVGIMAPNGCDWVVAQLGCMLAGKVIVPLPTFFSCHQIAHVIRDASVDLILSSQAMLSRTVSSGILVRVIDPGLFSDSVTSADRGFSQVIYTSGTTGNPKGVRLGADQLFWSARALAGASGTRADDRYLSVLPLSMLLETICAILVPIMVGASVFFDPALADSLAAGQAVGVAASFEHHQPTMSVLVPHQLKVWLAELSQAEAVAPGSLRFVAVGGASIAEAVAQAGWTVGIPVYEGYGLSECSSVVAVNRAGSRRPGTVGRPLNGIEITVDGGEIVVGGPTIMRGYLNSAPTHGPWRTGDLGVIDADGYLRVHGRKDSVVVTANGRNISPEWVETMLLADARIGQCAIMGHGEDHLTAILMPAPSAEEWFEFAAPRDVLGLIDACCAQAPGYAVPKRYRVVPLDLAVELGIVSHGGRMQRWAISKTVLSNLL